MGYKFENLCLLHSVAGFREVEIKGFPVITQSGSANTSLLHHRASRTHSGESSVEVYFFIII